MGQEQQPKEPTSTEIDEAVGSAGKQVDDFLFKTDEGQGPNFRRARERTIRESVEITERQMAGSERPISEGGVAAPRYNRHMPMPTAESLGIEPTAKAQLKVEKSEISRGIGHWIVDNHDYELKHLNSALEVRIDDGTDMPPITFLDYLVDKAAKGDMDKDVRDLLWSILRNINLIKLRTTSENIILSLRDSQQQLVHLYFNSKSPFDFYKAE